MAWQELVRELGARVTMKEPLAPHTTFRIGGPAALFATAESLDELIHFARMAQARSVPVFILGNGSNLLVRDGGLAAFVIENHSARFELIKANPEQAILFAESGAALPLLANRMAREGWAGLEWAIGIPGTIGAAVVGNAGAHGGCIADNLISVSVLPGKGEIGEMPKDDLGLRYRTSRFKWAKDEVILSARFELRRDEPKACLARMNAYTEHRRRTQPTEPSVGSIFKNPPGDYAGRLIDQAGLKGLRVGSAEVSKVHANFFVNRGGATAKDVLELIELVQARVLEKLGTQLELEIRAVGEN